MFAMILEEPGQLLVGRTLPERAAGPGELLARVEACGVCRTDLHVVDGELPNRSCRSFPAMRSSAACWRSARASAGIRRRRPRRRPLARLDLRRRARYCRARPRKPVRRARASPATRSTAATPSSRVADARYCFPLPERYATRRGAAALRRPDRLALAANGGRGASGSASTASAPPPTSSPRSRATGSRGLRLHPPGRRGRRSASRAPWAPCGRAAPTSRRRSRSMRRSSSRRSGRWFRRRSRGAQGGTVVCGGIHMSDIPRFPTVLWGERSASRSPT